MIQTNKEKTMKPHYNPKFHQYEICWKDKNGASNGVWGNTEEECLERYSKAVRV